MLRKRWGWAACVWLLAAVRPLLADEEYDQLFKDFNDARLNYYQQLRQAKDDETKPADPANEFVPKFRAYARSHAGKTDAIPALAWMVQITGLASAGAELSPDASWALAQLMNHAADPAVTDALSILRSAASTWGAKPLVPLFEKIYEVNPDPEAKANALYSRGFALCADPRDSVDRDARRKQGLELLHAVSREFPDTKAAAWAEPYAFEAEHLQLGMKAPDFAGEDESGKPVKLSDFKGKVVVIDFWGFW